MLTVFDLQSFINSLLAFTLITDLYDYHLYPQSTSSLSYLPFTETVPFQIFI